MTTGNPFPLDSPMISSMASGQDPRVYCAPYTRTALVAGKGSDLSREIRLDQVKRDKIPIYRRKGGGCSVLLDPGNIIVSLTLPVPGFGGIQTIFDACTDWLLRGLNQTTGLTTYPDGISDLVIENQKIGGSCLYRSKGLAYFSASILGTADLNLMNRYLAMPPREPAYRGGRGHREFLTTLSHHLGAIEITPLSLSLKKNLYRELKAVHSRAA